MSDRLTIQSASHLRGTLRPPSDKSQTHRAIMLAAAATSPSVIHHPLLGDDCFSTLKAVCEMGATVQGEQHTWIRVIPAQEWLPPQREIDCGNSGTTMRLLSGLIASRPIAAVLDGDASLRRRPMRRVLDPLQQMGASTVGERAPLTIRGGQLSGIDFKTPIPSAQIKSCILLAGLRANGPTRVTEEYQSRNHTENALRALGADLKSEDTAQGHLVTLAGPHCFSGFETTIPADISSAAFFAVAAALVPGSEVTQTEVGTNPTRDGLLDVFRQAGVNFELSDALVRLGEPQASLTVTYSPGLRAFAIAGGLVTRLIDEIPVLAVLATQCEGEAIIQDAQDLRVKESDRISVMVDGLTKMGAQVTATEDGMRIVGPTPLSGVEIDADGDHRIAMAFSVAGLIASGTTTILGAQTISTSYPDFTEHLKILCS